MVYVTDFQTLLHSFHGDLAEYRRCCSTVVNLIPTTFGGVYSKYFDIYTQAFGRLQDMMMTLIRYRFERV